MAESLKQLLSSQRSILAPGVGDAMMAKLVQAAGFPCVYISGYLVSATFGYPDVGLVTMTEMIERVGRIAESVSIPAIADADNGHGGPLHVVRTIRGMERAGVAAVHLEDQKLPKRCAATTGIELVSIEEMLGKLSAALENRASSDFLIIARTDAMGASGLDEALKRGRAYQKAGADAIMFQSPRSVDDLKRFRDAVDGPLVVTMGSWDLQLDTDQLADLGYQIVLFPLTTMRRAARAVMDSLLDLKANRIIDHKGPDLLSMDEFHHVFNLDKLREQEQRYSPPAAGAGR